MNARAAPSTRQLDVLRNIIEYFAEHRICPSYAEIAEVSGIRIGDVSRVVEVLAIKGWLIAPGHTRSLIVLADPDAPPESTKRPVLTLVRSEETRLSLLASALRGQMREARDEGDRARLVDAHGAAMARLRKERE